MQALDFALFGWVNAAASAPAWSLRFAVFASDMLPTLLALSIAAAATFDRRWRHAFFTALVSVLVVWLVVNVFRSVLPFPRPAFYGLGIQWVPQGVRPGFPSLHAAGTFTAAFSLLWCLPWRAPACAALAVAALVGWSRLYLGLHFPSDIAGAAILGALASMAVAHVAATRPFVRSSRRVRQARWRARARRGI